ncbi:MAG: hypothetical protein EOM22_11180 [Gammaproteobacteria bacterium]|nr:hypothetical protein [Gammaproteobacteria bacterium]
MLPQDILQQFASVAPGGAATLGGSHGGSPEQVAELMKALTASNYQTDVATLTNGGALGVQSLDTAMKAVVQEQEHFVLFKQLATSNATNIVDEYVRKNGIGGHLGGSTNTQMGVVRSATGEYTREIGRVKFLMTLRQVGYVGSLVQNIASMESEEEINGALQLMTDAEYLLFHGNAAVCPTEYDGIFRTLDLEIAAGNMPAEHVIDLQATPLDTVEPITRIGANVAKYGNWGRVTDMYLPLDVQTDLNNGLDPAFRWSSQPSNQPISIGTHVEGIRLQNGVLKTNMDTFIQYDQHPMAVPFQVNWPTEAAANLFVPAAVGGAAGADAASQFTAPRAGNYFYSVAGIGAAGQGQSQVAVSAQVAVAAGDAVTLTIQPSAAGGESGYAIYRSTQNGTNTVADMRLVTVVPRAAGGGNTTYVDRNREIPGTCKVPLLNMGGGADAIGWRQFNPMTKIPLPFGVGGIPVYSWFQFLFGYLRVTKPRHHGYITNVLPRNATWRPHG